MSTGSQPSHTMPPEEPFRCEVMPERDAVRGDRAVQLVFEVAGVACRDD